jgi:hypothetical protein
MKRISVSPANRVIEHYSTRPAPGQRQFRKLHLKVYLPALKSVSDFCVNQLEFAIGLHLRTYSKDGRGLSSYRIN